jgi:hypothetical protein
MSTNPTSGDHINAVVTGPVQGAVAIGKDISQQQEVGSMDLALSDTERTELRTLFASLREQVSAVVPESEHRAALERVDELEEALVADRPDLTTIEYIRQWFARKLPAAAGLVASVLVHPLVGRIIERAGDKLANSIM